MGGTAAHAVTVDTCMKSNWHTGSSGRQYPSLRTATGPQQATNMETHASLCSTCKKGRQVSLARPMRVRFGTRNKKRCSHLCSSTRGDQHVSIVGHAGVCAERLPCCLYSAAAAAASYVVVPGVLIWIWRWRDVTGGAGADLVTSVPACSNTTHRQKWSAVPKLLQLTASNRVGPAKGRKYITPCALVLYM